MAWDYEASGDGSDTRKIASMINAHNREYQLMRQATYGITARETAFNTQFGETLGDTNNEYLGELQNLVDSKREELSTLQGQWYDVFKSYTIARASEEFDGVSNNAGAINLALDGLILDMYSNSKVVEPSVISITNNSNVHMFHSEIHAHASELNFLAGNTSVQTVEKVSDKSSETLTFEVARPQNSNGNVQFNVYGDNPSATADVVGGMGGLKQFTTPGWRDFGILANGDAQETANSSIEFAGDWKCWDAISSSRFTTAPETALATRFTTAGGTLRGTSCIKWIGDDSNATLYIAQLLNNPLLNLNTTAWGSTANNQNTARPNVASMEGRVVICTFYYRGVPTGYTLTPELLSGGNTRTADETIQGVTSDGSSTWRLAVFAFYVRAGDTDTDLVFALKLTNGGGNTSSSIDVRIQRITLEIMGSRNLYGSMYYVGVPSVTPKALGAKDTFTLEQSSEGKWQKFYTRWAGPSTQANRAWALPDKNGQPYQLPSNATETELESLITLEDK